MNYRHGFHAGNHADVLKHVLLISLIDALQKKSGGIFLLDTHAGRGSYPLGGEQAQKTGEAALGIQRLWESPSAGLQPLRRYLDLISGDFAEGRYPGSPLIMARLLRDQDRLAACEIQADEQRALLGVLRGFKAAAHLRDGYEALPALVPPPERRGLVLIDPPYEAQREEFVLVRAALARALARWPLGVYALWYPIKQRALLRPVWRELAKLPARSMIRAECLIRADDSPLRLNGSGMLILNPPWQWEAAAQPALASISAALGESGSSWEVTWMKREDQAGKGQAG